MQSSQGMKRCREERVAVQVMDLVEQGPCQ